METVHFEATKTLVWGLGSDAHSAESAEVLARWLVLEEQQLLRFTAEARDCLKPFLAA